LLKWTYSIFSYQSFRRHVRAVYDRLATDANEGVLRAQLETAIQAQAGGANLKFTEAEFTAGWDALQADNAAMLDERDFVFLI
jgi:hypothetical protein